MAAAAPKNSADDLERFRKITMLGIDGQAKYFLREFVSEFAGNFEEVLELADEFAGYAPEGGKDEVRELDEHQAHLFLEKRGETATVKELRDALREIDIDLNMKVSFIEYCLYKYKKTLTQLLAEKPKTHAALLKALEEAIELHEAIKAAKKAEEEKLEELRKIAEAGTGVKAMKAKAELEQMRVRSQTGANMADVRAAYKKKKAQRDLDKADPMEEEMKKLAIKKKQEEEEEKRKKMESKERLKAKAAFLNTK